MQILCCVIAETVQELSRNLQDAIAVVKGTDHALVASISSGCELFLRFITLTALDNPVRLEESHNVYIIVNHITTISL